VPETFEVMGAERFETDRLARNRADDAGRVLMDER
jgi:hypothetical protein